MEQKNYQNIDIQQYMPQRPPFVMVDRIVDITERGGVMELEIREDNIFCDDGEFTASGLLENIAQSCAVRIGYINCAKGGEVREGAIGDIRDFTVFRNPGCGEVITTQIEIIEEIFNFTLARVTTRVMDEVVASAMIKIALIEPKEEL